MHVAVGGAIDCVQTAPLRLRTNDCEKRVFAASRFDKTVHHLVCGDDFFVRVVGPWRRYDFEGFLCIPIQKTKISKIVSGPLPGQNNQFGGGQNNHQNRFSPNHKSVFDRHPWVSMLRFHPNPAFAKDDPATNGPRPRGVSCRGSQMGPNLRPECVGLYLTRCRARVAIDVKKVRYPLEPPLADQIARLLQQRCSCQK